MKTHIIVLHIALLALLALPVAGQVSGFDQVGTTSFQFLTVVPNARAAAMGGVGAATINSSEAVFFNPAFLTRTDRMEVGATYLDYFQDVAISGFSGSCQLGALGVIGIQAQAINYGEIEETRVDQLRPDPVSGQYNPGLTGNTVSASSLVLGISWARMLTDKFAFGLTAKLASEDLVAETATAIIFDGGIVFRTGLKSLELGMMLRNFGADITYVNSGYPLPQIFAIGISGYVIGPESQSFFGGSESNKVLLAYDLSQTRDHSQQQHLGAEYLIRDIFAIRSGYKFNFDEESWTLGFGMNVNRFQLDYAYNDYGEFLGNVQRFTLKFQLQ